MQDYKRKIVDLKRRLHNKEETVSELEAQNRQLLGRVTALDAAVRGIEKDIMEEIYHANYKVRKLDVDLYSNTRQTCKIPYHIPRVASAPCSLTAVGLVSRENPSKPRSRPWAPWVL